MRKLVFILCITCLPAMLSDFFGGGVVAASERHALVIGNSDYLLQPLVNPRNDATDIATELGKMGYNVHSGEAMLDLNRQDIVRALVTFADGLPDNADVLFYYAGHGMSQERENYLIPLGHELEVVEQLPDQAVSLRFVLERLKNANPKGTNVVLLDACRDNPLTRSFRSTRTGLSAEQEIPRGVFIGYAADSGQVAIDGTGRNGVYTEELLNVMRKRSNVIIDVAHREVVDAVIEKTGGKQYPVSENKLYGNWCFNNCGSDSPAVSTPAVSTAFEPAPEVPAEPAATASTNRTWLIAGGVALAVVALLAGGSGKSDSPPSNFTLVLDPP